MNVSCDSFVSDVVKEVLQREVLYGKVAMSMVKVAMNMVKVNFDGRELGHDTRLESECSDKLLHITVSKIEGTYYHTLPVW